MKCSNCGKEIADDSQFCEFCGTQMIQYAPKECRVNVLWLFTSWHISIICIFIVLSVIWDESCSLRLDYPSKYPFSSFEDIALSFTIIHSLLSIFTFVLTLKKQLSKIYCLITIIISILWWISYYADICNEGYEVWQNDISIFTSIILILCYLSYSLLAHKKGWKY